MKECSNFEKYRSWFVNLTRKSKFSRLGRPFETKDKRYFYDTGTGKIFEIRDELYDVLVILVKTNDFERIFDLNLNKETLSEILCELEQSIKDENIVSAPEVDELTGLQVFRLEESLKSMRSQLTLELTEKCNMRCKYCVYHLGNGGFREFGKSDMIFDIARRAIDQFMESTSNDEIFSGCFWQQDK